MDNNTDKTLRPDIWTNPQTKEKYDADIAKTKCSEIEKLTDQDMLKAIINGGEEYIIQWEEEDWGCIGYIYSLAGMSSDEIEQMGPDYITKSLDLRDTARKRLVELQELQEKQQHI